MDWAQKILVLTFAVSSVVTLAAGQTIDVDTESEWRAGSFTQTHAFGGNLSLVEQDIVEEWRYDDMQGVEDFHALGRNPVNGDFYIGDDDGDIIVVDSAGNYQTTWSNVHGDKIYEIEVDSSGNVYTASADADSKKFDSSGNLQWTFSQHTDYVRDLEIGPNENIHTTSFDGTVRKFFSKNGSEIWSSSPTTSYSLGVDSGGDVYVGNNDLYRLDGSDGSVNWSVDISDNLRSLTVGPNENVFFGANSPGYRVRKVFPNGTLDWKYDGHNDTISSLDTDSQGNLYTAAIHTDDTIRKLNPEGSLVWRRKLVDSQTGIIVTDKDYYSVDSAGLLYDFRKDYYASGDYVSQVFNIGPRTWKYVNLLSDLNGEDGKITVQLLDGGGSLKSFQTFDLNGGSESFSLGDTTASQVVFNISMTGSLDTPEINYVALTTGPPSTSSSDCTGFGVKGCWLMDEGSGQWIEDKSVNANDGIRGKTISSEPVDPIWSPASDCYSGTCLHFENHDDDFVNIPGSSSLNIDYVTVSTQTYLEGDDGSPDVFVGKGNSFKFGMEHGSRKLIGAVYNSTVCGGWCGDDSVTFSGHNWFKTDYVLPTNSWKKLQMSWNGTHYRFYSNGKLVDSGSPSMVGSKTIIEDSSKGLRIGTQLNGKYGGWMKLDQVKIYNRSLGVCFEGESMNIEESKESSGRLKNDQEICFETSGGRTTWYDQDYGDVDNDGTQETCQTNNLFGERRVTWVDANYVRNHPHSVVGGIDDDWNGSSNYLESRPNQNTWNFNIETPVPSGYDEKKVSTLGFCAGDDQGEFFVTQQCNTGLCSTDNSVFGVSDSTKSCVLNGQNYDLVDNSKEKRMLYNQGESVEFDLGGNTETIACFDSVWYDEWPVSTEPSGTVKVNKTQTTTFGFRVLNVEGSNREFNVELQGDQDILNYASIEGETGTSFQTTVPAKSGKYFRINVYGGDTTIDNSEIRVQAEAVNSDISGEDVFKVDITPQTTSSSTASRDVPGIGAIHLIFLIIAATVLRFAFTDYM